MAFLETPRFPDKISFGATGGPTWQTEIAALDSGYEYANQNWSQARARYEVGHDARLPELFDELLDFFMAVGGRANQFRFKDWSDFSATSVQGVVSSLSPTTFQMYKRYTAGSLQYNRKIVKPVSGTVTVIGGSSPTVNYTTGVITVSSGTPTGWYGDFDVPVRFDSDVMQAVIINRSVQRGLIQGWQSIALAEVRL
jgi:uncharacterized protein (TIGR02217 family)